MVFIPSNGNDNDNDYKPTEADIRKVVEECSKRNLGILAILQVKFPHLNIPTEVCHTLSFTTFATALEMMLSWMPEQLVGEQHKAFHIALDGFVAVAIKGAQDELELARRDIDKN